MLKNERVFNLVQTLHKEGLIEKMVFHGHMRFGINNPPPRTSQELSTFKLQLKNRMKRYVEAGIPIGIHELDVIFLNNSDTPIADRPKVAGMVMRNTVDAYLEVIGDVGRLLISDSSKLAIQRNISLLIWGLDNKTSWTKKTKEGTGYVLYDNNEPQFALFAINKAFLLNSLNK